MGKTDRGRPSFLKDRVSTTVSLEREDLAFLHEIDTNIAEEFREFVKFKRNQHKTTLEKLKAERDEEKKQAQEHILKWKRLNKLVKEEEEKETIKKSEQLQIIQFESEREQIFESKFRKLIFHSEICEIDYYRNVHRELKFKDPTEAKEWLYARYLIKREGEKQFKPERIKMFLRWDRDLSRIW